MSRDNTMDSMLEMFIYETTELVTQLENIALDSNEESSALESEMNEVFRIVHTIKGAAAMMDFNSISSLAHSLEDAFFYIRENQPENVDYSSLTDVTLRTIDYIKEQIAMIQVDPDSARNNEGNDEEAEDILGEIKVFVSSLKGETQSADTQDTAKQEIILDDGVANADNNKDFEINLDKEHTGENEYKALLMFEDGCEMENLRSFKVLKNLEDMADIVSTNPSNIPGDSATTEKIKQDGFEIILRTDLGFEDVRNHLSSTLFLKELYVEPVQKEEEPQAISEDKQEKKEDDKGTKKPTPAKKAVAPAAQLNVKQSIISVNLEKLDKLMDLVGELVISQEMVVQNSELDGLVLNDFQKASRQLRKVTTEIQDAVMSIRMVPISATFHKMQRIVRDMGKKLGKDVKLELVGETTEVDKNVVEHLTDPLMHIIRNSMDHGIESTEDRIALGKPAIGTVTLEARDEGGDVRIIIRDDGRGLDRDKLLQKAISQGLVRENDDTLADKDIYSLIFKPGFSTKQQVTEFSGRGVGMDVVNSNMEKIGGKVLVDSTPGEGTVITLKIPLTLAIIDGMKVQVGDSIFVIPITSIKESFRVDTSSIILDDCNSSEMIMIRGECLPILRLHDYYNLQSATKNLKKGIVIIVENESNVMCLFADKVIGEQQVVVKPLPKYIKDVKGISGCTVMGDGSVCLISDVTDMFKF